MNRRNRRRVLSLLGITLMLVAIALGAMTPIKAAAEPTVGPAITIDYQKANSTFVDVWLVNRPHPNWTEQVSGSPAYMTYNDTVGYSRVVTGTPLLSGTARATWEFRIPSAYTALSKLWWYGSYNQSGGTSFGIDLFIYTAKGMVNVVSKGWSTADPTGYADLNSSYVVNGYIHGLITAWTTSAAASISRVGWYWYFLVWTYAAITETCTSAVDSWSDGTTRYQVGFTSFDYGVTATLTPPTTPSWIYHRVNPNCTRAGWVFSDLVPTSYLVTANGTNTRVDSFLWLIFTTPDGSLIPWGTFHCAVNGSPSPMAFRPLIGCFSVVNVTVVDDYGTLLYQNASYPVNATGDTFLNEPLTVYHLILANRRPYPQYARVSRNGITVTWSIPASPGTMSLLVAPGSYVVTWIRCSDGEETDGDQWTVTSADLVASSGYELPVVDLPYGPDQPEPPNYVAIAELLVILLLFFLLVVALLRRGGHAAPGTSQTTYTESPGSPRSVSAAASSSSRGAAAEREGVQGQREDLRRWREHRRQSRRR